MQKSAETPQYDNLFYIFVAHLANKPPSYYVILSKIVADYIKRENERARIRARELGRIKESSIRVFPHPKHEVFPLNKFEHNWGLLERECLERKNDRLNPLRPIRSYSVGLNPTAF